MDTNVFYRGLGTSVRRAREASSLTQEELAAAIGISRTSLTNMELGRQRVLVDQLAGIASTLKVSIQSLIPDVGYEEQGDASNEYDSMPTVSEFIRTMQMHDKSA
ncbi:helix-turn-helix domain-containing protein [Paraburkholderia sediminicola]|jgi:transcriptional regulator with XRE-family HTH domain|uniref:helix-turn-helix domain-containing protein n=1 Tax=Paraburkholderia sediminicola TaxID=458836 RepID=UPI0038B93016